MQEQYPYLGLDWLAETKFIQPHLSSDILQRDRLVQSLQKALADHRLILISAPAGAGKTTLLTGLAEAQSAFATTWLSIDDDDNDPVHFLEAMIAALRHLNPQVGEFTVEQMRVKPPSSINELRQAVSSLINSILKLLPQPFGLVLDDLHWITEPSVYQLLDFLLERMPPQMRLIVASRYDPPLALARLRSRGQLAELRLPDLRFTLEEIDSFLNKKLGLQLSAPDLSLLQGRTEGWAAGLRMLASSLARYNDRQDRAEFLNRLVETDRYLFDYLAEEVLGRQEPETRRFLLETSILPELTPWLCEAVTGRKDSASLLEDLYRRNLFVIALDERRWVYRYHDLFAEFLQERLKLELEENLARLHGAAARAQCNPAKAVRHYIAAELWEEAATSLEQSATQMLEQGLVDTLGGLIKLLPEPVRQTHPWLSYYLGVISHNQWEFRQAETRFQQAYAGFEKLNDLVGIAETSVYLEKLTRWQQGNAFGKYRFVDKISDVPISVNNRIQMFLMFAMDNTFLGNLEKAAQELDEVINVARNCTDPRTLNLVAAELSSTFCLVPGTLARLKQLEQIVDTQIGAKCAYLQTIALTIKTLIQWWDGEWEKANQTAMVVFENKSGGDGLQRHATIFAAVPLAYYILHHDSAGIKEELKASIEFHEDPQVKPFMERWRVIYLYWQGRLAWEQGHLEETRQALEYLKSLQHSDEWVFAPVMRYYLESLLEISNKRYTEAELLLKSAAKTPFKFGYVCICNDVRILRVYLYLQWQRFEPLQTELKALLAEYKQEERPGLLMWQGRALVTPLLRFAVAHQIEPGFAQRVLQLLNEPATLAQSTAPELQPVLVPESGETLTSREVEVIQFLAQRASNREIAQKLYISEETVKTHVSNILRKLDITSRTEVAGRAAQLKII